MSEARGSSVALRTAGHAGRRDRLYSSMDVVGSPGESGGARTDEIAPADAVSGAADVRLVRPSPDSGGGVVPVAATESAGGTPDYQSDRIVAIPLPREGELYVRYGPADRTIPAAPSAGPIVPSPTATAQERPPPALDAEGPAGPDTVRGGSRDTRHDDDHSYGPELTGGEAPGGHALPACSGRRGPAAPRGRRGFGDCRDLPTGPRASAYCP